MTARYWPPVDRSFPVWHPSHQGADDREDDMTAAIEGLGEWARWIFGGIAGLALLVIRWFIKDRAAMHADEIKRIKEDNDIQMRAALERSAKERESLVAEVERTRQAAAEREAIRRESAEQWSAVNQKLEAIQGVITSGREATASEVAALRTSVAKLELRCDALEHRAPPRRRTNP